MRTATRLVTALSLCLVLMVAGCGGSDLSTPKAAAKTLATALEKGDVALAKKATTGGDAKVVESLVGMFGNLKKLQDAMTSKFGDEAKKNMKMNELTDLSKKVDEATEKVEGDKATLTFKSGGPMTLKKVDGSWKVDVSDMMGPMGADTNMLEAMSKAAKDTADEVSAGKFKTYAEADAAMGMKMMGAMMGGMKPPGK